jgi:hypothetical protein
LELWLIGVEWWSMEALVAVVKEEEKGFLFSMAAFL